MNIINCLIGILVTIGGRILMERGMGRGNFEGGIGTFLYGCLLFVIGTGSLIYELTDFL